MQSDYDLRQTHRMKSQIDSFKKQHISLSSLINDLMFLRDALEHWEPTWEKKFTDCLVDLESINADMIIGNKINYDELAIKVIENALAELLVLISSYEND